MKTLYFFENGSLSHLDLNNASKFEMIDISTDLKGPVYTLVKSKEMVFAFKNVDKLLNIEIELNYSNSQDENIDESNDFFTNITDFSKKSKRYSVYPLIKQLISCNDFISNQSYSDKYIILQNIIFRIKNYGIIIINEFMSDAFIKRIIKEMHLITCVQKYTFNYQKIIFLNKYNWGVSDFILQSPILDWNTMLIPIEGTETCYKLKKSEFENLYRIEHLEVSIVYQNVDDHHKECYLEDFINRVEVKEHEYYYANNIYEILNICLYVPQLIQINQELYNTGVTIVLTITSEGEHVSLTVSEDESKIKSNTCIFRLLKAAIETIGRLK